jgi:fructokinase
MGGNSSIICMGELLIDFFCTDVDIDLVEGKNFEKQAGGAPANVSATIAKLGGNAILCGKIGNDPFGLFLKKTLDDLLVDTSMVVLDDLHPTTLAFVSLKANGERDFVFNRGADAFLTEEEIDKEKLKATSILHFGSATALLSEPFQSTYLNAMKSGKEEGKFISFDPNYRIDLWKGRESVFVDLVKKGISIADFVKVSDEELRIISGMNEMNSGVATLHQMGAKVVAIDSTGAGDAFVGATLFQLANEQEPKKVLEDFEHLKKIISFSNKVGAMVCTKVGAIYALPNIEEIS